MIYLGIDPGVCGGVAVIASTSTVLSSFKFKDATEADIAEVFRQYDDATFAMIERVSSSPQMGVVSAFTFGRSYGFLRGMLIAHGIAFEEVSPVKWQTAMGCRTGGNKNISKAKAQQLFPGVKVTHANADALLLAEHCRRTRRENCGHVYQDGEAT